MKSLITQLLTISLFMYTSICFGQKFDQFSFDPPMHVDAVNTEQEEEAAPLITPEKDRMYFTRTTTTVQFDKTVEIHEIWFSDYLEGGWAKAVKAFHPLNDDQNTAVIGFKKDGLYLFGIYNKILGNKNGASESHIENGAWTNPASLSIPDLKIKSGFYGLSMHQSENILLISKGEEGNEDLFVTLKNNKGEWSELINLGSTINSAGYEIAPFLSDDSQYLFFSRGTLTKDADIYISQRLDNTWKNWSEPERLPEPINSDMFDAYFSINSDSTVLFSSDRMGSNDIYQSKMRIKPILPQEVALNDFETIAMVRTEEIAEPVIEIKKPEQKRISDPADGYIFFDFNRANLSNTSKKKLDEIIIQLKNDPTLKVEISGHADYIDTEDFNQALSEKRALNAAEYLISQGISADRIRTFGYGELLPISNNDSEIGRRLNRRVEISIRSEAQ
ncbi:OmpA family protein [Roseivirga sp.]|uniref:OmpA family protein n=1 Tax=Roseivirga sp. TaxID=1964215 RepID=UPI003B51CE46